MCCILQIGRSKNRNISKFLKVFDFIHREKMQQIVLAYGFFQELLTITMMHFKNAIVMVRSVDDNSGFLKLSLESKKEIH